jgi:iron complex outermembrane receptor protein
VSPRLRAFARPLVVLALALSVARPALADARTEARAHFRKGMEAIAAGRYDEGIPELEKAYEILPHPNVLYNIARAHAEAGDLEKAIDYFRRYLDTNPSDKDETVAVVKGLEARLRRQEAERPEPPAPPPAPTTPERPVAPPPEAPPPAPTAPAPPPPAPALGAARTEDVFAESIVTASKGAQSPVDAASSTSVITEQDIRLSGITKIPELLRRLAGVDVMEVTGGQTEVSIRGFNQRLANKTLVLVDGRSVYADILGATIWQTLSIGVEDIQRIEVVRGPGSALYGADAFNGVVNIITKKPGEASSADGRKSGLAGAYGSQATTHGSLWASGREGDLGWRMAAGYDYLPRWSREVPNGRADVETGVGDQVESSRTIRLDARGSRRFGKAGTLSFGGGLAQGSVEVLGIGTLQDIVLPSFAATDVTTSWTSEHLDARVFWNRLRAESSMNVSYVGQSLLPARIEQNVVDGEVAYKANVAITSAVSNDLHVGTAYRYRGVVWSYLDEDRSQHYYALFLHDELKIAKPLALVVDYRLDWVPYLERFVQSPRAAALVHPSKQSTIRASVATAFRKPTFLESYLRLPIQLPVAGAAEFSEGVRRDDPDFKVNVERILSAELGYLNQESDVFTLDTAIYWNRVTNLINLAATRPLTVADFPTAGRQDISTGLYPISFGGWDNQCQAYNVYGGEASVRTYPIEGLDLYANYTLNLVQQDNSGCTVEELSRIVSDQRTSRHKVNAGVQLRTKPGFDGSVDLHYVAEQYWAEQVTDFVRQQIEQQRFHLEPYVLLNARVGYRFLSNAADVGVVGFNVLGLEHREHPFGQLLGRRVMVQFSYRF